MKMLNKEYRDFCRTHKISPFIFQLLEISLNNSLLLNAARICGWLQAYTQYDPLSDNLFKVVLYWEDLPAHHKGYFPCTKNPS